MEQISDTTSNKREFEVSQTFSWQLGRGRERKKRKRKRREGERERKEGGEGEEGRGKKVEKGKVEYIPSNLIQDYH